MGRGRFRTVAGFAAVMDLNSPDRLHDSSGRFGKNAALPFDLQDAVDRGYILSVPQVGLADHIVCPQPLGNFTPVPQRRSVSDVASRGRKSSRSAPTGNVLADKLTATVDATGDFGLSDQITLVHPEDFRPDRRVMDVLDGADDRVLQCGGGPREGQIDPPLAEADRRIVAAGFKQGVLDLGGHRRDAIEHQGELELGMGFSCHDFWSLLSPSRRASICRFPGGYAEHDFRGFSVLTTR